MNSDEKREIVKMDYDLIADQYCNEFGSSISDEDFINRFASLLKFNSKVVDLGGGPGQVTKYLTDKGYDTVCYDFSEEMKRNALRLYPGIPYILDDIVNIKGHFFGNDVDGIIAMYSLFHIPREELKELFKDIYSILKTEGILCFTLKLGSGEKLVDEPLLKENGKNVLYVNYLLKNEIHSLLSESNFDILFEEVKKETGNNVLGAEGNDTIYIISRKN